MHLNLEVIQAHRYIYFGIKQYYLENLSVLKEKVGGKDFAE